MAIIAVAGGAGPVGKCLVDGLVGHGGHKVYVLSRSERPSEGGVSFLKTDYGDVETTAQTLQTASVDTFVSAIGIITEESNRAQLNMIRAAYKSSTTRRFVLSSFDMLHLKEHIGLNPIAKHTFEAIEELDKTDLEYTRVANGWFSDYYGLPHWRTHLHPWINVVSMEKKWAAIPGDGSARANFITTRDFGKFFGRLMDLEKWCKISIVVGDELSLNELVELAEKTRGCKFTIVHDSLDKLKSGKISFIEDFPHIGLGDGDEAFYALVHYQAGLGHFLVPKGQNLNAEFPEIKITKVSDVMEASWKGK